MLTQAPKASKDPEAEWAEHLPRVAWRWGWDGAEAGKGQKQCGWRELWQVRPAGPDSRPCRALSTAVGHAADCVSVGAAPRMEGGGRAPREASQEAQGGAGASDSRRGLETGPRRGRGGCTQDRGEEEGGRQTPGCPQQPSHPHSKVTYKSLTAASRDRGCSRKPASLREEIRGGCQTTGAGFILFITLNC